MEVSVTMENFYLLVFVVSAKAIQAMKGFFFCLCPNGKSVEVDWNQIFRLHNFRAVIFCQSLGKLDKRLT